ncbi:hypothetical protein QQX98_008414 [Neonectria punicea]|uniref:NADP-dependent oxidoreductase domain-containing protein n=1 Tax=Neonectria punicea TaxID=979145 RepID=A0ABR1GVJ9_9HYPO
MSSSRNRLILGTMTIGPDESKVARITSMDEYKKCLDYLSSKGYNELNTAGVYVGGLQEGLTRDAGFRERGFSVASKVMPTKPHDHKADKLREYWETSLRKLGVDCAEIMYLHAPGRTTSYDIAYRGFVKPTVHQGIYNAMSRSLESELEPRLRKFDISLIICNPPAAGLFSGKYTTLDEPADDHFNTKNNLGQLYTDRYFKQSVMDTLALIEPIAKEHGIPLIETALRWRVHHSKLRMRSNGGHDGIIIGISSYKQLEQNIEACEKGPLPDEVVEVLDSLWQMTKADAPTYWRWYVFVFGPDASWSRDAPNQHRSGAMNTWLVKEAADGFTMTFPFLR